MAESSPQRLRIRAKFFYGGNRDRKVFLKGVTYGPFAPGPDGVFLPAPDQAARDLDLLKDLGANLLRVYHVPPGWFLDKCARAGIQVLVSIPWANHVAFLDSARVAKDALGAVREGVRANRGHPAILGYYVGNEASATMVRWLGARRVLDFIEDMIAAGRAEDPDACFAYASYPPTEYLIPQNAHFYALNVFLHDRASFRNYVARLQNLAGDKPLLIGEFGLDTKVHPLDEQAEMLEWFVDEGARAGLAGATVFSFTDDWHTGGEAVTGWEFGLVTRDRAPKPAYLRLREKWKRGDGEESGVASLAPLPATPKVSVIVCSFNGARTLESCLASLRGLRYPDYEVILIDDGSTDATPEIGARFPEVRVIRQENLGLSAARNRGAREAAGEILAYTDDDCMVDGDWLYYLVGALLSGEYAGVGGPNISPPAQNLVQACVSAAPGNPTHVLLDDVTAEHVPGCNMAFPRWAFESIGGFDPQYRKAGDDVDFCWRLQDRGHRIAFSPAAVVWHHRRFTISDYLGQQEGYGEAESILRFNHSLYFGKGGSARWKGTVYLPNTPRLLGRSPVIYHGIFGHAAFQAIYPERQSEWRALLDSFRWTGLTIVLLVLVIPWPAIRIPAALMLGGSLWAAIDYASRARIEPGFDGWAARILVAILAWVQPLTRGLARYQSWMKVHTSPRKALSAQASGRIPGSSTLTGVAEYSFWSEDGTTREEILQSAIGKLQETGWRHSIDTGWKKWDLQVYGRLWWMLRLLSVTEYHGGKRCLTRVRLALKPSLGNTAVHAVFLSLAWILLLTAGREPVAVALLAYAAAAGLLWLRGFRLLRKVSGLIHETAAGLGLQPVRKRRRRRAEKNEPKAEEDAP